MKQNLMYVLTFIGGVAVGFLFATAWFFKPDFSMTGAPQATSTGQGAAGSALIAVVDQPAGPSVAVAKVLVPAPGVWVAIAETDAGGIGNILGAARAREPREALTVPLLRPTAPDRAYAVVLYRDNGDERFDLSTDSVYVDFDTGGRVVAPFKTLP